MKNVLIPLLSAALIAALSFVAGRRMALWAQPHGLTELHEIAWLQQQFDLTPDQVEALLAAKKDYHERVIALCDQHCAARNQLAEQLFRQDWTPDAERALLRKMGEAQVETDAATLDHFRRVRQILAPAQREQYEQIVASRMQAGCPHHLHHGALTKHGVGH